MLQIPLFAVKLSKADSLVILSNGLPLFCVSLQIIFSWLAHFILTQLTYHLKLAFFTLIYQPRASLFTSFGS